MSETSFSESLQGLKSVHLIHIYIQKDKVGQRNHSLYIIKKLFSSLRIAVLYVTPNALFYFSYY